MGLSLTSLAQYEKLIPSYYFSQGNLASFNLMLQSNTARLAKEHEDIESVQICGIITSDEKRPETVHTKAVEKLREIDPDDGIALCKLLPNFPDKRMSPNLDTQGARRFATGKKRVYAQAGTGCVLRMDRDHGDSSHAVKRKLQLALMSPLKRVPSCMTNFDMLLQAPVSS